MAGYGIAEWDPDNNGLELFPGPQGYMGFDAVVAANNLYVLTFQVYSDCPATFTISTAPLGTGPATNTAETVNVAQGKTGFAYAFDAAASGGIWIQVSSSCAWEFQSAELTTTAM